MTAMTNWWLNITAGFAPAGIRPNSRFLPNRSFSNRNDPRSLYRRSGLVLVFVHALPELDKFIAHRRIEPVGRPDVEGEAPDQLLNVGQVPKPPGTGYTRCQLQFNDLFQAQAANPVDIDRYPAGSGKATGFGLPSPGYPPVTRNSMRTPCAASRRSLLPAKR